MSDIAWDDVPQDFRDYLKNTIETLRLQASRPKLSGIHGFAGVKNMERSFHAERLRMYSFEVQQDAIHQNCLTPEGERNFLKQLAIIHFKPGGLAWLDPPCSGWVWMCRHNTKRSPQDPHGDTRLPGVLADNRIAEFVAKVMLTCKALKIGFVLEQPKTSVMPHFPAIRQALDATNARRVYIELWKFHATSQKPLYLWGTVPWLHVLVRISNRVHAEEDKHLLVQDGSMVFVPRPTQTLTDGAERGQVNGRKQEMKASAAYPLRFCQTIASLHRRSLATPVTDQIIKILAKRWKQLGEPWFRLAIMPFAVGKLSGL